MKTIYRILVVIGLLVATAACNDESRLSSEFEYTGPIPEIADGPSEAQKICYDLYQKYDHNVYYTLSGDEALRTNVGQTQINMLYYLPESAWPLEAADEVTAESFLKLLKSFYDALPEEIVKTTVIKRQVLIKVNFWFDMLLNYYGVWAPEFMSMGFTDEAQQGIVYWGEIDDNIGPQPELWKYSIVNSFFKTRTSTYFARDMVAPLDFAQVSAGKYLGEMPESEQAEAMDNVVDWMTGELNMDYLRSVGFVEPYAFLMITREYMPNEDMATYATWIACHPLEERQEVLNMYPLVKRKYDLTLKYYKENLKIDLEEFSRFWVNVTVE